MAKIINKNHAFMDINLQFCHYSVFIVHKINSCNNATQLLYIQAHF